MAAGGAACGGGRLLCAPPSCSSSIQRGVWRRSASGRGEEGLGQPTAIGRRMDGHDFFLMTWHDVVSENDAGIVSKDVFS